MFEPYNPNSSFKIQFENFMYLAIKNLGTVRQKILEFAKLAKRVAMASLKINDVVRKPSILFFKSFFLFTLIQTYK